MKKTCICCNSHYHNSFVDGYYFNDKLGDYYPQSVCPSCSAKITDEDWESEEERSQYWEKLQTIKEIQ